MFTSTTQAIENYVHLYQQFAVPRSIPLGKNKTHISRGDSRGLWEKRRDEFAKLAILFPSTKSMEWYLLIISISTAIQPKDVLRYASKVTGKRWTQYTLRRATSQAYGNLTVKLRERGLLSA